MEFNRVLPFRAEFKLKAAQPIKQQQQQEHIMKLLDLESRWQEKKAREVETGDYLFVCGKGKEVYVLGGGG